MNTIRTFALVAFVTLSLTPLYARTGPCSSS